MSARRIYLASSWRNPEQPGLVEMFRQSGHEVYDFRNPRPGDTGFAWSEIDPDWLGWTPRPFRDLLDHPIAVDGFSSDFDAMQWADTFVLALPCGRSAHLEAGWAIGAGKPTAILLHEDKFEPELMYRMASLVAVHSTEVVAWLDALDAVTTAEPSPDSESLVSLRAREAELTAALRDLVDDHGIEHDDERLDYVTLQFTRSVWLAARAVLADLPEGHSQLPSASDPIQNRNTALDR